MLDWIEGYKPGPETVQLSLSQHRKTHWGQGTKLNLNQVFQGPSCSYKKVFYFSLMLLKSSSPVDQSVDILLLTRVSCTCQTQGVIFGHVLLLSSSDGIMVLHQTHCTMQIKFTFYITFITIWNYWERMDLIKLLWF